MKIWLHHTKGVSGGAGVDVTRIQEDAWEVGMVNAVWIMLWLKTEAAEFVVATRYFAGLGG